MIFRVNGVDAKTGAERQIDIEADSEAKALAEAKSAGLFTTDVATVPEPQAPAGQSTQADWRTTAGPLLNLAILGGICAAVVFACSGLFSGSNSSNDSPSPSYAPSAPYRYDDTTDQQLKDLPSLSGFSDREKEHIISEAKKLEAALRELERQRGR